MVIEEQDLLKKLSKAYAKTAFVCKEDTNKEILRLIKKDLKKVKHHNVNINILVLEKNKKGRQPKDASKVEHIMEYYLQIEIEAN